jgi:dTDP-glucose 4,6-dehydratase
MSAILVTGGAGFIGSNFVRHVLATLPDDVIVLDKLTYAGSLLNLEEVRDDSRFFFVQGDIADRDTVQRLLAERRPRAVINFAAESHVDRSIDDPGAFVQTNIVGVYELLEAARRLHGELDAGSANAFRFLHVSTDEVYGSLGDEGLFTEETAYAPNSPYAASKAAADHLVRAYHETYELPVLVTNCSNNYGPLQFPEKLIPLMVLNAAEGKPLPIYGDGLNVRDWLYVEDHCAAIALVLEQGVPGRHYNVGGDSERTNIQVVDALCAALEQLRPAADNPALVERGVGAYAELKTFVDDRRGHDRRYAIDASRIRGELGWEPRHDFESGIVETVRWYLENPTWCEGIQNEASYRRQRLGRSEASR